MHNSVSRGSQGKLGGGIIGYVTIFIPNDFNAMPWSASAGCGTAHKDGGLPVTVNEFRDPDDSMIDIAVQDYLKSNRGPLYSKYDYTRVDLDGDGRRDVLVMFSGPHSYWCDMNGCSLCRLQRPPMTASRWFRKAFPVRGPLYVAETKPVGGRT